jgi:ABC-type oligopeptide transport system substrate-binding subunit
MYTEYIQINTEKPPMNDARVRHAFTMAIDINSLAKFRHTAIASSSFVPIGVYPGYPVVPGDEFNPAKAKQLLAEAGYRDTNGNFDPSKFPIDKVNYTYNTNDRNRQTAEFIQAQWKQNLGLTVPLKNMEFRTFLDVRAKREYEGFARGGWIGDYLDPFSYLNIFITINGDNGTGWWDQKFVDLLNAGNRISDPQQRFAKLAEAERMLLDANPIIPLFVASTDWMKKPYVKGMYPNPITEHPWKYVYIERDPAKWDYGVPSMKE